MPSPPQSPPLAATAAARERHRSAAAPAGAAHKITDECERLFCDDLDRVFHGERKTDVHGSLVIGAQYHHTTHYPHIVKLHRQSNDSGYATLDSRRLSASTASTASSASRFSLSDLRLPDWAGAPSSVASSSTSALLPDGLLESLASVNATSSTRQPYAGLIQDWLEVWDYVGGARFRGFTATNPAGGKTMFVFFDADCAGKELKQGLMALLELASTPALESTNLVVALDRAGTAPPDARSLVRDLGWCGFEAVTLEQWTPDGAPLTSRRWFFMGVDV